MSVAWLDTFMVQTLFNVPGFVLAGATQNVILLTNCFFGALVAIPAYYYLRRAGARCAMWGMMLFSFYPAAINFSLFGLRDIVIYTMVATYVLSMLAFTMLSERRTTDLLVAALMCILVLWQRAELIAVMLAVPGAIFAYSVWRTSRSERTRAGRIVLLITGASLVITSMVAGAGIASRVIASQLGAESLNVATVATVYATKRMERASRNVQNGGESNILPRAAYLKMDPVTRTLLQTGGIIILPYPWLLNSPSRLFAALDSIFLISLIVIAVKYGMRQRRSGIWAPLLAFALGVLMMGLIVSNAGNAFRMRLALVPFVFSVASLAQGRAVLRVPIEDSRHQEG
jgi:predicted membrane-bound mannosyltransferase